MYFLKKPSPTWLTQHLTKQNKHPFAYTEVGYTKNQAHIPTKYTVDHNRILLGYGQDVFEKAKTALNRWEMFNLGWVELCWPTAPLEVGTTVGVLVQTLGLWSINCTRIVYLVEEGGPIERFGFAYGTLPDHAEQGEERFTVEWHQDNDTVWYDILAFSVPNQFLSRVGYLYVRQLQKAFAHDSKRAMQKAIN